MRYLDTKKDILGYDYSEDSVTDEVKNEVRLSLSEETLNRLVINFGDDSFLGLSIRELVRVYELVRKGEV